MFFEAELREVRKRTISSESSYYTKLRNKINNNNDKYKMSNGYIMINDQLGKKRICLDEEGLRNIVKKVHFEKNWPHRS